MDRIIKGAFDEDGFPYLNLQVLNRNKNLSAPAKAIIDTGAAHCLVREEIAVQLELEELRVADYRHPVFGKMPIKEYIMDLCFEGDCQRDGLIVEGIRAGTLVDPYYPASVIIGVELLRHCTFTYDGRQQTFTLSINL
ncbi:MAG: hypothetical protein ICV53_05835 [Flavisolibacter sp.]|nr:hypothetical protein [Flavisolibacter sp.]